MRLSISAAEVPCAQAAIWKQNRGGTIVRPLRKDMRIAADGHLEKVRHIVDAADLTVLVGEVPRILIRYQADRALVRLRRIAS